MSKLISRSKPIMSEKGIRRSLWLNAQLDQLIEETRKKIGLSRSAFLKNATMRYLENISVITTKAHQTNYPEEFNQTMSQTRQKNGCGELKQ
jgi:hypothetical protein